MPTFISGPDGNEIKIGYDGDNLYYIQNNIKTNITDYPINISNLGNGLNPPSSYLKINIISDIPVNDSTLYFNLKTDYIQIDGQNNTFTINSTANNYKGLINYDSTNTGQNINIQNIHVDGTNSNLYILNNIETAITSGWIGQYGFKYGTFTNCSSKGNINIGCGGIIGSKCAENGIINIYDSYSNGDIFTVGGGIIGSCDGNNVMINIQRCYSTGKINNKAGGIFGVQTNTFYGTINIKNCYSTGYIGSLNGPFAGSGGIFASNFSITELNDINININNCYSIGIIGQNSGGIFGSRCFSTNNNYRNLLSINNCYSYGNINQNGGGIFGSNTNSSNDSNNIFTITNCSYNGYYDPTTSTKGNLAGSGSTITSATNILGFGGKL
jgi:hypothetical protein